MKRIAVFGACAPVGFGDALQYYNLLNILSSKIENNNFSLTFLSPVLKKWLITFKDLKLKHFWIDISYSPLLTIVRYKDNFIRKDDILKLHLHTGKFDAYNENIKGMYKQALVGLIRKNARIFDSIENITSIPVFKLLYRHGFDAGIIGGHTLGGGGLYGYVQSYRAVSLMVKGPIVLAPTSLSLMGFKHSIELSGTLRPLLSRFEHIYVRGPYTLKLIKKLFGLSGNRVSMCLDSGFWHLLDPVLSQLVRRNRYTRKERIRVLIYPRKDFFYAYNKNTVYSHYLYCLKNLITKLSKKYDCELVIVPSTINGNPFGAPKAVQDLVHVLKSNMSNYAENSIRVEKPRTLVESLRLFSSSDLVVTSYMHAGVMALSAGVPAVFILPKLDIKVLDVLRYLRLRKDEFFLDMFDTKLLRSENLFKKVQNVIENLEHYKKTVFYTVDKALQDAQRTINNIVKLMFGNGETT